MSLTLLDFQSLATQDREHNLVCEQSLDPNAVHSVAEAAVLLPPLGTAQPLAARSMQGIAEEEGKAEGCESELPPRKPANGKHGKDNKREKDHAEVELHFLLERVGRDKQLAVEFRSISAFVPNLFGPDAQSKSIWQTVTGRSGSNVTKDATGAAAPTPKQKQARATSEPEPYLVVLSF